MTERIEVHAIGVKEKMQDWINNRGGVQVWSNMSLSYPAGQKSFTPADAKTPPDYRYARAELVTDIKRFRFIEKYEEVKRFHVAVRMSTQGTMMKCTEGSTRRIYKKPWMIIPDAYTASIMTPRKP